MVSLARLLGTVNEAVKVEEPILEKVRELISEVKSSGIVTVTVPAADKLSAAVLGSVKFLEERVFAPCMYIVRLWVLKSTAASTVISSSNLICSPLQIEVSEGVILVIATS